jgi:hypothetical protein
MFFIDQMIAIKNTKSGAELSLWLLIKNNTEQASKR